MITPEQAWSRIDAALRENALAPLGQQTVPRNHAASRVLAEAVLATIDVPGSDVSAMDGFTVGNEGARQGAAGHKLEVKGIVAAGDAPGAKLEGTIAMRIMTGAPVPEGADRVIPFELTSSDEGTVSFEEMTEVGAHIRRQGEVNRVGQTLLEPGTLLTDATLGLFASHGILEVPVFRKPRIAMLTTGNEVVPPEQTPGPGQLRDSHSSFFASVGQRYGESIHLLGIARDDPDDLRARIEEGLQHDVLIMTGGVSKGDFDLVEETLQAHGCQLLFDAVAIQPGKPVVAGYHDKGWVFALPGNPASAMVTFWLFVRPALRRMQGLPDSYWGGAVEGTLVAPLPGAKGRDRFFPARARFKAGRLEVEPVPPQGSHDVAAYATGTGLVRVPAGQPATSPGDTCQILPLVDWWPE